MIRYILTLTPFGMSYIIKNVTFLSTPTAASYKTNNKSLLPVV